MRAYLRVKNIKFPGKQDHRINRRGRAGKIESWWAERNNFISRRTSKQKFTEEGD